MEFLVVIEKGKEGYWTYSPELPGCTSFGETVEEAVQNMKEAIRGHLDVMRATGEDMPVVSTALFTRIAV